MTLPILLIYVGIAAIILTLITVFGFKTHKSWIATFLQNYVGALFIFSGWVKAADPLGTGYKNEQYFAEFVATFQETWFSFLAPLFSFLNSYATQIGVAIIVFEIILGIMLIIGAKPKFASRAFFGLVLFFTFLTGFTYLTGYVPNDANFFDFGAWGGYSATNMRVTDCGCFGDFLKLEPKVSFFKDIFLLIPGLYFLFNTRRFHTWFTTGTRTAITSMSLIGVFIYCLSNFVWDIPHLDFRPFFSGADVATQKQIEDDAQAAVKVLGFKLKNQSTGEEKDVAYNDYLANLSDYPSDTWKVTDQILGESSIPLTKVSDFDISDIDGHGVTEEILHDESTYLMIVCYKVYGSGSKAERTVLDTIYSLDTTYNATYENGYMVTHNISEVKETKVEYTNYIWKEYYAERFTDVVNPFVNQAKAAGIKTIAVIGGADKDMINDFKTDVELDADYYTADDILLKTIVRSNPGIVLWSNGKIIDKWHYKKLPSFEEVKKAHIK